MLNLYVALVHYPVINKNGETIASAVTNLDLHDIARLARTYGVPSFFVVTPLTDQKILVERIVSHWTEGCGGDYNPKRRQALERICVKDSLADVLTHLRTETGRRVLTVATSAKESEKRLSFGELRGKLVDGTPYLLLFGTAWGLSGQVVAAADYTLTPVCGPTDYNHLSVRAAAAIILDRLVGNE